MFTILQHPDPILATVCDAVIEDGYDDAIDLATKMVETLKFTGGVGLAANQIGDTRRVIIARIKGVYIKMINPFITNFDGNFESIEGCLSIQGKRFTVPRADTITVTYIDESLFEATLFLTNFEATIIQHEVDHLNGITLADKD
jgi:peptide deformylase